ncbi:MAG TPA: hypothetical protein VGM78_07465, partial [Ilumatobacteraceae bacterium]
IAALGVGIVLVVAACGSSGTKAAKVATLGTTTANTTTDGSTPKSTQDALLAYAACMRTNGVDMKDPTFDANGNPTGGGFGANSGVDRTSDAFKAAQTKCGSLIQGITLGRGANGQGGAFNASAIQDGLNDFTACLREQGLNVNDISFANGAPGGRGTGGGGFGGPPGTGGGTNGSVPAGATSGSTPGGGGGFGPPGTGVGRRGGNGGNGRGAGFDPSTAIISRLGLDAEDPAVTKAVAACQSILTAAFQGGTGTTTTTAG